MKKTCIFIILSYFLIFNAFSQRSDLDVYDGWSYYQDVSNTLYKNIYAIAAKQINKRDSALSALNTDEKKIQYTVEIRQKLKDSFGTFPQKTPLNPVVTGKIVKETFTVEKLYFESRPNYYVTAALFYPTNIKGRKPAVLYCCGHNALGFRTGTYQQVILNLVNKGFVVLAFDPVGQGERFQYFDNDAEKTFRPTHEHSYPGSQLFISGLSAANFFVWDGIRAIDYLCSREEVDIKRIGVTGRSGGGTQAAYIAAMDDRVVAAAPECYTTSYDMLLRSKGPQDAEQILMNSLEKGLDIGDLISARAPKPTLMITTTRDFFSIQGARNVFGESKLFYNAYGHPENLSMVEDDEGHAPTKKNREALYSFLQKHLNNPGTPNDLEVELFDEKDLWVSPKGQIQHFIPSETLFSQNKKYADSILSDLQKEKEQYSEYLDNIRTRIEDKMGYKKTANLQDYIFAGRLWEEKFSIEKYLVRGLGDYYIPILRLCPKDKPLKTILLLDEKGKSFSVDQGIASNFAKEGFEVIVPDLSGMGELGGGFKGGDARIQDIPMNVWYAGVLTKKSPFTIRVEEIDIVVDFIESLNKKKNETVGIACGTLTSDLLHATFLENRFDKIALLNPLYSYVSIVKEKNYHPKYIMSVIPEVIGSYDLPDLISAIAPLDVLMLNPVNAMDEKISLSTVNIRYTPTEKVYEKMDKLDSFTVEINADSEMKSRVVNWLLKKQ